MTVPGERLEMLGRVIVRDEKRVVISCGGLIVSVTPAFVLPGVTQSAAVVFTRSPLERQPVVV